METALGQIENRFSWRNEKGTWQMASEERKSGDFGLLGEHTIVLEPTPQHAQFPTRVIRGDD